MSYYFLPEALLALKPNVGFTINGENELGNITWTDDPNPIPSNAEIIAKCETLQKEYDAQEYARNRKEEYPDWGVQLDYIYHNGVAKWKTDIVDPVKVKYPKPE